MARRSVCEEARATVEARGEVYGDPCVVYGLAAELASPVMRWAMERRGRLEAEDLEMILLLVKLARHVVNPAHRDSLVDLVGYAELLGWEES